MNVERIESGLQSRSWSFNRPGQAPSRQLVLLLDGGGEAEVDGERHVLSGPAVLWLGSLRLGRLRIDAGAAGYRAWVENQMIVAAIGDQAESASLGYLVDRDFVLSLAGHAEQAGVVERCVAGIHAELRQPQQGSPLLVSALVRIVLVALLRVSGGETPPTPASGERPALLQRFRQLVEMNFRSHWTIAQYAEALRISPDRLHAICTTGIGKSPKALVSERLAHEAAIRLERSALTIEQLGHALGFGDPAHFSNFFRRMTGMAPGRYRSLVSTARAEAAKVPAASFADWP